MNNIISKRILFHESPLLHNLIIREVNMNVFNINNFLNDVLNQTENHLK